jgi:hypothetical protein
VFLRKSGGLGEVGGCDQHDQHPGLPGSLERYAVQVQQDFGNRYILYADGTVEAWGRAQEALGVNLRDTGVLESGDREDVVSPSGAGQLSGVAMLTRGDVIHQTRALVRSADPAGDGKVFVWGAGLPAPRPIPGLERICWIAGPYAVDCNGLLFFAKVTSTANDEPVVAVSQVLDVPTIWRVNADFPVARAPGFETSYSAIAESGAVFRLEGAVATAD